MRADLIAKVREPHDQRVQYLSALTGPTGQSIAPPPTDFEVMPTCRTTDEVLSYAITAEREMLINLRDAGTISDDVLRRVQQELDFQEAKIAGNANNLFLAGPAHDPKDGHV